MKKNCLVTRMVICFLAAAMTVSAIAAGYVATVPEKAYAQEYLYTGTLDISSKGWTVYNTGLNYDMTGGTAGSIRQGAKLFVIAEKTNKSGNVVAYVYSEDLKKNCYVSSKYIAKDTDVQEKEAVYGVLDISAKGWTRYNTGLNYNMTGGTAGTLRQGAKLTIINEKTNKYGNAVSYCYSEDLKKYCYITSKYISIVEPEPEAEEQAEETEQQEKSYREKIVEVALTEYKLYGGVKLAEPIKYNYNYSLKAGGGETRWCADFICWCAEQAKIPMSIFPHEKDSCFYTKTADGYSQYGRYYNGYSLAYVSDLVDYLTKYCDAAYYAVDSEEVQNGTYIPKPGDVIVYRTQKNTYQHVGLVVDYDASTKKITTIEGNTSSGSYDRGCIEKKRRVYDQAKVDTNWYIQGYVSPNYED